MPLKVNLNELYMMRKNYLGQVRDSAIDILDMTQAKEIELEYKNLKDHVRRIDDINSAITNYFSKE